MYTEPPIFELNELPHVFVDDRLIAGVTGMSRRVMPMVKHSDEPIVKCTLDAEGALLVPCTVLYDEAHQQWRMWYASFGERKANIPNVRSKVLHLAVSDDAIHWRKPSLNVCEVQGSTDNNLCSWEDGRPVSTPRHVFLDTDEPDPSKRYKLILYQPSYYLAYSADGIRWRMAQKEPVWTNGCGDGLEETSFMFKDPLSKKYRGHMRIWRRTQTVRLNGWGESKDLIHWTGPKICFGAQTGYGLGAQLYGMNVHVDQGLYWGLPWMFYTGEPLDPLLHETMRFKLAWSTDGKQWTPMAPEMDMLPMGKRNESFDWGMMLSQCPVVQVGNENFLYYCGMNGLHTQQDQPTERSVGLARWRKGGFVSMAAQEDGRLLTQRFYLRGSEIRLNARTQKDGWIQAEILRDGGSLSRQYHQETSDKITGDHQDVPLTWNGSSDITQHNGQSIMLRLIMHKAEVYSFRAHGSQDLIDASRGKAPVEVGRCIEKPVIDGILNDESWQNFNNTGVAGEFSDYQKLEAAEVQTRAMLTYDDKNLYIAVECDEPLSDQLPKDKPTGDVEYSEEETIDLRISAPEHDTHVHQFLLTSTGRGDHHWFSTEKGGSIPHHPGKWEFKASVVPGRWILELAIPFETLTTGTPKAGDRWKLNLLRFRQLAGPGHNSSWSCVFGANHRNDLAGTLVFK